jgi:type IV pilus assembly protein PilQ
MKNIIALILCVMVAPWGLGFSQDNIYGDYLIYSLEKNVSLDLESAQLVDVLKMLAQQTKLNFVSTEAVRDRELTLYMENVPLKEAMNIIFKANNLAYDYYPDSNIFVVKEMGKPTLELKSKVYKLKYVRVESTRMQTEIDNVMGTDTSKEDQGDGEGEDKDKEGIKGAVESVLTEFGKVTIDPIQNALIVVDVPSRFPMVDEVVRELDMPVPKVLIEVEMLDVAKGTVDAFGVNWPQTIANLAVNGTRETAWPFGDKGTSGSGRVLSAAQGTLSNMWAFGDWGASHFGPSVLTVIGADLALDFFRSQSDTKFLARPKILTLSNETAEVRITTDEAIGVTETIAGTADTTSFDIERAETGTRLRVTPQVDRATGDITLFVEMVNKIATDSDFVVGEESFISGTIKNPEERSTTANVRLKDGECLFMGGLIRKTEADIETKVPILGDIPYVGRLFRHNSKISRETELLVFITPKVIEDAAFRPGTAKGSADRREQGNFGKRSAVTLALDSFVY